MINKTASYKLFETNEHLCIVFTSLVKGEGIQANQFLIINNEEGAIIDPGGDLTYSPLTFELLKYTRLERIKYVCCSHQDPDIITSMPRWLMHTKANVVASELWARFLPHLSSTFMTNKMKGNWEERLIELPDKGLSLEMGKTELFCIPAHFLHSVGNFQFYDPISKTLFSGDLGASIVDDPEKPVTNFNAHISKMLDFHQRYMCSNRVLRYWVQMVREMEIDIIVPQHGSPFKGQEIIQQLLDWLWDLPCGVETINPKIYRCPKSIMSYA